MSLGIARLGIDGNTAESLEAADLRMYDTKTKRKQVQRAEAVYSPKLAVNE